LLRHHHQSLFTNAASAFSLRQTQLVNIPSNIFASITFPDFTNYFQQQRFERRAHHRTLATLETLLCIEAIDKLDKRNRITPVNRELIAQGLGNMTCGLLGAIPITAVVVRGAANVDAGAQTKHLLSPTTFSFAYSASCSVSAEQNPLCFSFSNSSCYRLQSRQAKIVSQYVEYRMETILPFVITILVILSTDLLIV
jgi:hypothetical protein